MTATASSRAARRSASELLPAPIGPSIAMCWNDMCASEPAAPALHAIIRRGMHKFVICFLCLAATACATMPPPAVPQPPQVTWEEKLQWMMRLEDQRIVRDPNPPTPVILAPATRDRPAVVAPPPPSDL